MNNRTKLLLAALMTLFVFALLALGFWGFIRDAIVLPVYRLMQTGREIGGSIPQSIYLVGLVGLCAFISYNAVRNLRVRQVLREPTAPPPVFSARYSSWRRMHKQIYGSEFTRKQFAWEMRQLLLAVLVGQEGGDSARVEARIREGTLTVPDAVKTLIQRREIRTSDVVASPTGGLFARLKHYFGRSETPPDLLLDRQVDEIITYIESRLEIRHAPKRPE